MDFILKRKKLSNSTKHWKDTRYAIWRVCLSTYYGLFVSLKSNIPDTADTFPAPFLDQEPHVLQAKCRSIPGLVMLLLHSSLKLPRARLAWQPLTETDVHAHSLATSRPVSSVWTIIWPTFPPGPDRQTRARTHTHTHLLCCWCWQAVCRWTPPWSTQLPSPPSQPQSAACLRGK